MTPRRPAELEVDCATEDMTAPVTLTTKDVGAGGLFIRTEYPLEAGTRFGTRFDLGDGRPILAECEVAWVRTGPPESQPPPGMGVRFVALDERDAGRLSHWITGEELSEDAERPRMTFRIEGLAQTVPGELRATSDEGMSAVAELPFLKVGSAVQVTVDEAGSSEPRAGRIAWLVMEENEEDDGAPPRVRIGIHFDPEAEAKLAAIHGQEHFTEPVPLTQRKAVVGSAPSHEPAPMAMGVPDPIGAAGGAVATPWSLGVPTEDPSLRLASTQDRPTPTRRRVRARQSRGRINVGQAWQSLREGATRNPRLAIGAGAFILVLLVGLISAFALSGRGQPPSSKAKATTETAAVAEPDGIPSPDPQVPVQGRPEVQGPSGNPAPSDGADAPPPLPGEPPSGRQVLASGPNVNADPERVLPGPDTASGAPSLLKDPPATEKVQQNLHFYTLGNKLVVKLPTKEKPQSVKHYLLADPDGAVVDAVGTTPRLRPGRYPVNDPRVNFVRVLHRGQAARFIVYYGKGVKGPKMNVMPSEEGVSFVITTAKGASPPATAQRGAATKPGVKAGATSTRAAAKAGPRTPAKATGKLQAAPPKSTTQKRPTPPKRPAPIADAEDLPVR